MKYFIILVLVFIAVYLNLPKKVVRVEAPIVIDSPNEVVDTHINDIIKEVNERNKEIQAVAYKVIMTIDNVEYKADVSYKHEKNFRMLVYGTFGRCVLDIGSNEEIFWFWSKGYDPNAVYYSTHEGYYSTRLKTPFSANWIRESLGFGVVSGGRYEEDEDYLKVYKDEKINLNRKITRAFLIDQGTLKVVGNYIYENNKLLLNSEWKDKTLQINWYEENKAMTIRIVGEGKQLDYNLPVKKRKVNMENY